MIESNLADNRSYEWLSLIRTKNYNTALYYLSTDDISTNVKRVQRRVAEGGHDVPESIIISRYAQSHSYLKSRITLFKEVHLIDNSTDTPLIQVKIVDRIIVQREPELLDWVKEVISIYERLQSKRG